MIAPAAPSTVPVNGVLRKPDRSLVAKLGDRARNVVWDWKGRTLAAALMAKKVAARRRMR